MSVAAPPQLDALVVKHRARAYRLARRMTGNESDAEEIVQEAFLRVHLAVGRFRGEASFGTWFHRIVVNEALMRKRAAARRPTLSFEETTLPPEDVDGDTFIEQKRLTEQVRHALDSLDPDHREALVLREVDGLSSDEVAELLGVHAATVRQRAHRARVKLRGLLGHLADG